MTIGDVCIFKLNFSEADFWLVRKGSEEMVGTPIKTFSPENIGVKIIDTDVIDPVYLYYVFLYFNKSGKMKQLANGSLRLKHISISDIKKIKIG